MHAQTCARASSAARQAQEKPFLTIADISSRPGFDAFLARTAHSTATAPMVVNELAPLAETHRFQRDLWKILQTARRRAGMPAR